ncbi:MAG: DsrE family protein [Eubacteriaceae bacterium]|nr:DsrE family protein [Eubacteriaceae bacterium]
MDDKKNLHILWTNTDLETTQYMVMMYAVNSLLRGWWDSVTVVIWGGTARLAGENEIVRQRIEIAQAAGVKFEACIACARELGVVEKLEEQNIIVRGWGESLSNLLQNNEPLITI